MLLCGYYDIKYNFYGHFLTTADSRRGVVSYWRKYWHLVLIKPHNYTNGTQRIVNNNLPLC